MTQPPTIEREIARMVNNAFSFKSLFIFWYRFLLRGFRRTSNKNITFATQFKYQKYDSLLHRTDLNDHTLIFDVEGALLKSSPVFPYFMLVAFEAGGFLRAIVLILLYPFVCLAGEEMGVKIMIMICFFGIKAESFRVGRSVLPKFFLEDVGLEIFEVVSKGGKKVGLSKLPRVMVESFLKEYLEIDFVVGRELKVFRGYYVGLIEERQNMYGNLEFVHEGKGSCSDVIGISGYRSKDLHHEFFSQSKEIYTVTEADKKSWQQLSRKKYPKPLIFHDGRLALRPTLTETLAMLTWIPFGFILALIRSITGLSLPYIISYPLLAMSGLHLTVTMPKKAQTVLKKPKYQAQRHLYVCNHRTLLDPLYISFTLKRDLVAVTYSLSRMSEILSPIKTVRLTRTRNEDAKMMKRVVKQGDVVVCPEGTTCREPYLLRFSPLFSEICDEIVPVAIDSHVSMFHGTTAGGIKCLDPLFFLMNPFPVYSVQFLEEASPSLLTCDNEDARFEVANQIQTRIAKALGFECTKLTRKDKYLILAGNEGIVSTRESGK